MTMFSNPPKGDDQPSVALVFTHLSDLYYKIGRLRESNSYCESARALRIYTKPVPGTTVEESAPGMMEISAIFEDVDELERHRNAWSSFEIVVAKLRASGERKSAFFGDVLIPNGLGTVVQD
ncbi:hypothetical protein IFM89_009189 [Coptis chinensis]|uniref:Uncharacterized protein n=1 Tax=Coptis chinensis TaxID=261450 RepID=A0A835MHV0_9MAGN|nr:hypothetical protein IFM89_009189 [Coptis chinensis]